MKRTTSLSIFVAVSLLAALAFADPALDAMAGKLAELRAEVEGLSTQVEEGKQSRRAETRSFAAQKADLEFQLQREERRLAQLTAQMTQRKERIAEASVGGADLVPAIEESMTGLRGRIETGLPFKTAERTAQVDELKQKLVSGVLTPEKATVHLWALVEDELRLGRENGLYRQIIELDGEELLVDVARLGMVTMYYRTDDGRTGWVERGGEGWRWVSATSEQDERQIELLFDALRKQIRTGWFELPGTLGGLQ